MRTLNPGSCSQFFKLCIPAMLWLSLAGCTTSIRDIPDADKPVSVSQSLRHCREVKQQCEALEGEMESEQGQYEQWDYDDGSVGCQCQKP